MPRIRRARPEEWEQSRTLRLEMLQDTPHSFSDHWAEALEWDDDRWIARHDSYLMLDSAVFVAVDENDRWVGHMAVREFHNYSPARAWLMSVYVTPAHRGDGTAVGLLDAVEAWTVERGFLQLYLDVHENALAARTFYARRGYRATGCTSPYPLDPTAMEVEMVKSLRSSERDDGDESAPAAS